LAILLLLNICEAVLERIGMVAFLTKTFFSDLGNNSLHNSIPSQIGLLTRLGLLYLQQNQLDGTIPMEFTNLSLLGYL